MRHLPLSLIASYLCCHEHYPPLTITGYSVDSRSVKSGDLFFALKGQKVDGHRFLHEVRDKGASAAIVNKNFESHIQNLTLIKVEDPLIALQTLAKNVLLENNTRIVAITGSLGKTTTKEFTKTLLSEKFYTASSPGNQNSQIGLPLTILNHTEGHEEIAIFEMGMTERDQIKALIQIAPPEVAVITHVSLVHSCNFASLDEIANAKGEILSHPLTKVGIIPKNVHNFHHLLHVGCCKKTSFALSEDPFFADFTATQGSPYTLTQLSSKEKCHLHNFHIPGKHNLHNLLAAIAVARHFNMSWDAINHAIPKLSMHSRRLEFTEKHGIRFLNDSYNAAEESVKAALEILPKPEKRGRKIAVLGSMLELGSFSDACHERVGKHALKFVEKIYCLGSECQPILDIWKSEGKEAFLFHERSELLEYLKKDLQPDDVVLLKGSRAKELWKILEEI